MPWHNSPILTISKIIKFAMYSATKSKLTDMFITSKKMVSLRQTIVEMCWTQPPYPLQTNKSTAAGVTNNKMVSHQTKSMDMRFSLVVLTRHPRSIPFLLGPQGTELGQLQHQASTITVPRVPPIYLRWLIPACPSYLWAANPANCFSPLFIFIFTSMVTILLLVLQDCVVLHLVHAVLRTANTVSRGYTPHMKLTRGTLTPLTQCPQ